MSDKAQITGADIDSVVGWTIIRAARRATRILGSVLEAHDLTTVEFGVLMQLAAAESELTQAQIARAVGVRSQSVAPVLDALSDRGLLRREGERGRGRVGRLLLSDAGAARVSTALPDVLTTNSLIGGAFDTREVINGTLLRFLEHDRS